MANRQNIFLLKGSNIPGKVPSAGDLQLKELAINFADVILYASGTTSNSILPIGWDRIHRTGDTMTGPLYSPSISATTISATTFYGNASGLIGITDTYVTGGTYSAGTAIFTNTTGGTFSVSGFSTGSTSGSSSFSQSVLSGLTITSTTNLNANLEYTKNFSGTTNLSAITFTFSNFNDGSTIDLDLLKTVSGDTALTFPSGSIISASGAASVTGLTGTINSTSSGRFTITTKNMGSVYKVYISQDIL